MTSTRSCYKCKEPIHACMGFVCAGDFVANESHPRELCGKCVLVADLDIFQYNDMEKEKINERK